MHFPHDLFMGNLSFNLILTIELTKVKSSLEETADDNDNKNPFL